MERLSICIDLDGTVTDPYYWLPRANEFFKKNVTAEDVTSYRIHEVLGIEAEAYEEFYHRFGPIIHLQARIRDGVHDVVNELFHNHFIHFITAREETMRYVSLEWLKKHHLPMDSISLLGHPNKVKKAQELNSDFFIEDSLDNAVQLAGAGFEVLLIDCNYNKGPLPAKVTRVFNWHQINRIIQQKAAFSQIEKAI